MSEMRRDPVRGAYVVVAEDRARQPLPGRPPLDAEGALACPFCEHREALTPPEIRAVRPPGVPPDGPGWRVRVVPHRSPALRIETEVERRALGACDVLRGPGAHEVVIDGPRHTGTLADLEPEQAGAVLATVRERLEDLRRDRRLAYGIALREHGIVPGAPAHGVTQVVCTPGVPSRVREEAARARAYHALHDRCPTCDLLAQETEARERIVLAGASFVAMCPFASAVPFELWIAPRRHAPRFEEARPEELDELGRALPRILGALDRTLERPRYTLAILSAPFHEDATALHWRIEVAPLVEAESALARAAGLARLSVPPEEAARALRASLS